MAPAQGAVPALDGSQRAALESPTPSPHSPAQGLLQQGRGFYQGQRYQEAVEAGNRRRQSSIATGIAPSKPWLSVISA